VYFTKFSDYSVENPLKGVGSHLSKYLYWEYEEGMEPGLSSNPLVMDGKLSFQVM
jgi:hypothetical protein